MQQVEKVSPVIGVNMVRTVFVPFSDKIQLPSIEELGLVSAEVHARPQLSQSAPVLPQMQALNMQAICQQQQALVQYAYIDPAHITNSLVTQQLSILAQQQQQQSQQSQQNPHNQNHIFTAQQASFPLANNPIVGAQKAFFQERRSSFNYPLPSLTVGGAPKAVSTQSFMKKQQKAKKISTQKVCTKLSSFFYHRRSFFASLVVIYAFLSLPF